MPSHMLARIGLGALLLLGTLAVAPAADTAKDRAKWRLASLAAAREILDEFGANKPLAEQDRILLVETLDASMRAAPADHVTRAGSRRRCAELAAQVRRQALERRIAEVARHASEQSPLPVQPADVTTQLGQDWPRTLNQSLERFVTTQGDPLFQEARARAVGRLRQDLERQLRFPSAAELDALLTNLVARHPDSLALTADDERQLQQAVEAMANPAAKPCFEELRATLAEGARLVVAEIRNQYQRQLALREDVLLHGIPGDRRQASTIRAALETALAERLARATNEPASTGPDGKPAPAFPLFAPLRDSLPGAAAALEQERLRDHLNTTPLLALQADALAREIRAQPRTHATPARSESAFLSSRTAPGRETVAAQYAGGAVPPVPAAYFQTLIATNALLAGALEARLKAELAARLPEARRQVRDEQYKSRFAGLERLQALPGKAVAHLLDSGGAALKSLDEVRSLFGLEPHDDADLIEETVSQALAEANRKARAGYEALTAQLALVRALERDRLDALRRDVTARRSFKSIRAEWQEALESRWASDPRATATPYAELLEPARELLDKTVRQLYDALQENPAVASTATPAETRPPSETARGKEAELRQMPAQPEDRKPDEQKANAQPKDPQPSPTAGGTEGVTDAVLSRMKVDRRNEPDGILLLSGGKGGNVTAQFLIPAGTATRPMTFTPDQPQQAADAIFDILRPTLETLWTTTVLDWQKARRGLGAFKRKTAPTLRLFVIIESDDVRHRMSLFLRQHIDRAFAEWREQRGQGTPEVELDWKVGLTFEPVSHQP